VVINVIELITNTTCTGNTGAININITGTGTAPYAYKWTGPASFAATSEDISGLAAGNYTIEITDANGCMVTRTFTIGTNNANITISENVINMICGGKNGAINIHVPEPVQLHTYSWTGANGSPKLRSITSIDAGNYTIEVTMVAKQPRPSLLEPTVSMTSEIT
jgi:hypothetical protein